MPTQSPRLRRASWWRSLSLIAVAAALVLAAASGCSVGSTDVAVVGHNCTPNADGSVHVQGELSNDGGHDETAVIEFMLTLYGGETETSKPFGGYSVPAGETSLVGEDLNVPPGVSVQGVEGLRAPAA